MADLSNLGAESQQHEGLDNQGPIPMGNYPMMLVDDEVKTYEEKQTVQSFLKYQIISGTFAGTIIKDSCNLVKSNGEINPAGKKYVENLFYACGHTGKIVNSSPIKGKPFVGKVVVKDSDKINPNTGKPYKNNEVANHYKTGKAPTLTPDTSSGTDATTTEPKKASGW